MAALRDNWTTGLTTSVPAYDADEVAQTFTPSENYAMESVQLKIFRTGAECNTYTIALQETTADKPDGNDLVAVDFDADLVDTSAEWKSVNLAYSLVSGTKYAIVLRQTSAYVAGSYLSLDCYYSATYTGGQACTYTGGAWGFQGAADADYLFKVYSAGDLFPSDAVARTSSIRHIFRPGFFRMQVGLGDLGFDVDVAEATVRSELEQEYVPLPGAKEAIEAALAKAADAAKEAIRKESARRIEQALADTPLLQEALRKPKIEAALTATPLLQKAIEESRKRKEEKLRATRGWTG